MNSAERFLQDFHQRGPGTTPSAFAGLSLAERGSSYDVLAATSMPYTCNATTAPSPPAGGCC